MSQMEEAKAEVEKKVTKKELVGIVNDLHEQCQLLCSVFHDLEISGRKGKSGSSSRSSSDLDYYSSEEIEVNADHVSERLSSDYAVMLRKIQETELTNEDLKRKVSNLRQETDYLRDQNMERTGDIEGKRNEDKEPFKELTMTKDEVALLRNQKKELELKLEKKTNEVLETVMRLKRLEKETEERAKAELKIVKEKEDLRDKVQRLQLDMSEAMKSKITEIDLLKEENQKLHKKFAKREMKNIDETEDRSKKQEDIIDRLSMEIKDQKKLLKEQKDLSISLPRIRK
ncbi:unnamed protein product [Arabis nemorensis]|uniref:NAB domain-containing protein n=1 Tax=Arabis nemorensis TaxID=586526 RepID=A0A565C7A9_9BRAS|nr:unnamed protein product [Arabis nemorensis]